MRKIGRWWDEGYEQKKGEVRKELKEWRRNGSKRQC